MKYQAFDSGKPNGTWEVWNTYRNKLVKRFDSDDEACNKASAVRYVQQLVENDRFNEGNND